MTDTSDWIEHRRPDGERVGWMLPADDGFIAIDLLGRNVTGITDWLSAEETLDELGIGYLADPYRLTLDDGHSIRVRLTEVSQNRIVAKLDDFGDARAPQQWHTLDFPAPEALAVWGDGPVTWPASAGT